MLPLREMKQIVRTEEYLDKSHEQYWLFIAADNYIFVSTTENFPSDTQLFKVPSGLNEQDLNWWLCKNYDQIKSVLDSLKEVHPIDLKQPNNFDIKFHALVSKFNKATGVEIEFEGESNVNL